MSKVFKIVAAPGPDGPKSLQKALEMAEKSGGGVVMVPPGELNLTIDSGVVVVVGHGKD
jgi:hypothetical protein